MRRAFLMLAAAVWAASIVSAWAEDARSPEETRALQRRLTDAGCFHDAIDGRASSALDAAVHACPDPRPFLRIETGMHTAQIKRIGVDAACRRLVTGSNDKTIRVWSLPEGRLEQVIRWPIGEGNEGKVYAVALSPDGRWFAAGGWDASPDSKIDSLTIVDLDDGSARRYGAFPDVILHIAFSPDGARVAIGLGAKGMRVLDRATGRELMADADYADHVYGLAFAPDGSLLVTSYDGFLRRYGPDLKLATKRKAPSGARPLGIAVDPSGARAAVGYDDNAHVSILDAKTLASIAEARTSDVSGGDLSVAWSGDGATLIAGGGAQAAFDGDSRVFLRRFDRDGHALGPDAPASHDTISNIQRCGDGFAFAAGTPPSG